jgi:hypothetical protein
MQENRLGPPAHASRGPQKTLILWLLFLGVVLSFCGNIYQDMRAEALARDIASVRLDTQKQIVQLREAQTASLEQDLLRLDQLTGQLQKTNDDVLRESALAADRTKAELARTVEQRHQEMIRALSDIRSDLRANVNARQNQSPRDVQDASAQPERPAVETPVAIRTLVSNSSNQSALAPTDTETGEPAQPAGAGKKKQFWSKLNPFRKKPATAASSTSQSTSTSQTSSTSQ